MDFIRSVGQDIAHGVTRGYDAVSHAADTVAHDVGHAASTAAHDVGHAASTAAHDVGHAAGTAAHDVGQAGADVVHVGEDAVHIVTSATPQRVEFAFQHYVEGSLDSHHAASSGELSPEAQKLLGNSAAGGNPAARASLSWDALTRAMGEPGSSMTDTSANDKPPTAWSLSQAMTASLDQAKQTGDYSDFNKLTKTLQNYRSPSGGYAPDPWPASQVGQCYYDDNSWIGLAFMQAYNQTGKKQYLQQAQDTFKFLRTGMVNGGLEWHQGQNPPTWNTCTEGAASELALQLHEATGKKGQNDQYLSFANQLTQNMNQNLRQPNGLYKDHVYADPALNEQLQKQAQDTSNPELAAQAQKKLHSQNAIYSYNQGTPIGANVALYKITGDHKYLDQAQQTAGSSLDYLGQKDRLWKEPGSFNAIYFRNLMQLNGVAPDSRYTQALNDYAGQVWEDGRDPSTGLFNQNGIGLYDNAGKGQGDLLDQAGFTQIFALEAWPSQDLGQLT